MLVSRILVIVSLQFIFIQDVTETGKENPVSDGEHYTGASSGSGQSGSDRNCDDVYTNCSFHYVLANVNSNGLVNITANVMLLSVISLVDHENITIIGLTIQL